MMTIHRRIEALENCAVADIIRRLIVVQFVRPGVSREPIGIEASEYLPAVDRMAGESWGDCIGRVEGMLPPNKCVVVLARYPKELN